ncbi:MAG TPA: hypothetical protein VEU96_15775 [Bryobacteraceae bacterium]|nr:hypothetical protein [Bryobacteraceae bacterium]
MVARVLILALLQGGILLQGGPLGYALNGTATGFFGGVDVSGWFSADFSSSSITVSGPPSSAYPYSYTFSGPLNGAGYTQTSQIPPTPCIIFGCVPSGAGQAGLHVAPVSGSASLNFEDTGEDFIGNAPLVYGWILNGFQGGPSSAPVPLTSPGPVAVVTGSLTAEALQDYYDFQWLSGAFSVTANVSDAPSGASYAFSVGVAGTCSSAGSATLNGADSFTGTIAISNLPPGQYCIGINTNNTSDPPFQISFNTPVTSSSASSAVPEPSGLVLLSIGLLLISWRLLARQSRLTRR